MAEGKIVDSSKVKAYRPPGQRRQWRLVLLVVVLVVGLAVAAYAVLSPRQELYTLRSYEAASVTLGRLVQTTQASGQVAFPVQITLVSPEIGSAAMLYVSEGDWVQEGQLLAKLSASDMEEELEDLRAGLLDAGRSLTKEQLQSRVLLSRKQRQIDALERKIENSMAERNEVRSMVIAKVSPMSELDAVEDAIQDLIADRDEQRLQLSEDLEIATLDEQDAQASISALEVEIQRQQDRIAAMLITGPIDGEVLEVESALGIPGSAIKDNQTLFTIADPSSAVIELEVLEQYASVIRVGQLVELSVGTLGLSGKVVSVGRVAQQSADGLGATVLVRVVPDSTPEPLLSGATAVGVLEVGVTESALLLPRGPYLTTGSQRHLYVIDGDRAIKVTVTFGQVKGNLVEVVAGVEEGDLIVVSGYQNFIENDIVVIERSDG